MKTTTIQINSNDFLLHPSGAMFWKQRSVLLISDVHLGKVAHFRKHGIAIPQEAMLGNFNRLSLVVEFFQPKHLVFLGDLFHSKVNNEWDLFADWTASIAASIALIEGNHDILEPKFYSDLGISCHKYWALDGFLLTHHPQETPGYFNFCGHVHPGIRLREIGRNALSLPCFFYQPNQLILPAFGEFTGNFYLTPKLDDKVYATTGKEVLLVFGN